MAKQITPKFSMYCFIVSVSQDLGMANLMLVWLTVFHQLSVIVSFGWPEFEGVPGPGSPLTKERKRSRREGS